MNLGEFSKEVVAPNGVVEQIHGVVYSIKNSEIYGVAYIPKSVPRGYSYFRIIEYKDGGIDVIANDNVWEYMLLQTYLDD